MKTYTVNEMIENFYFKRHQIRELLKEKPTRKPTRALTPFSSVYENNRYGMVFSEYQCKLIQEYNVMLNEARKIKKLLADSHKVKS